MSTLTNIILMTYFVLVAIIGTLGNGVILFAYGNRWSSSKSTSVVYILVLACFDLWTCLIAVPTIAIMEYRDFDVPTLICRFYSFSKNLIIISSFIMSFVALDRFLNIALPHSRLLNPRRVKVLLILFISIGIGLGTLTALAFSTQPNRKMYIATYDVFLPMESFVERNKTDQIFLHPEQNSSLSEDTIAAVIEQISFPVGANISIIDLEYKSTLERCFADTSIISEFVREVLKHISNKFFFISIGIVTIFYTITFILALQRQKPRIRALKKSLNVLNKFDTRASIRKNSKSTDSSAPTHTSIIRSSTHSTCINYSMMSTTPKLNGTKQTTLVKNISLSHPDENSSVSIGKIPSVSIQSNMNQQYEMSSMGRISDVEEPLNPLLMPTQNIQTVRKQDSEHENHISISDGTSDDLGTCAEKLNGIKQVSFQVQNRRDGTKNKKKRHSLVSNNSFDDGSEENHDIYYKFPCPCSKTRQLLIKFHFSRPSSTLNRWFCCCCSLKRSRSTKQIAQHHGSAVPIAMEDEASTQQAPPLAACSSASSSHSETLRRQLHQHRLKQIRMALTFLFITVSFVLFYLPSILNAERIIKSSMLVYYLYLCTHALNPIIYCFMNPSLRAYILSMFRCRRRQTKGRTQTGAVSIFER